MPAPRPHGRGKKRQERGRGPSGAVKRPRVESSSSERRDESGGSASRSGRGSGMRDKGMCRADRPRTPPQRTRQLELSPGRSPRFHCAGRGEDPRKLPLAAKTCSGRVAHSTSASEDKRQKNRRERYPSRRRP